MFFLLTANAAQSSRQLWLRPQVLGDVLDGVLDDLASTLLFRSVAARLTRMQFLQPHTSRIEWLANAIRHAGTVSVKHAKKSLASSSLA
jgi:hypothetical protein